MSLESIYKVSTIPPESRAPSMYEHKDSGIMYIKPRELSTGSTIGKGVLKLSSRAFSLPILQKANKVA